MKTIIIVLFTGFFLLSCTKENNINTTEFTPEKFQQILNDNTWYEITDTINHNMLPLFFDSEGVVLNSKKEAIDLYISYLSKTHFNPDDTSWINGNPKIDYDQRTLLIHYLPSSSFYEHNFKIFRNDYSKKYLSVIEIISTGFYDNITILETVSVPKLPNGYAVDFKHYYSKK